MKPKTMILMVVAVACGLGASYMTSRLLADRNHEIEKVPILVAKKKLNMGELIKAPEELFEERLFPKGDEPKMAINEFEKLKGQQLKRPLRAGDFVTADDLRGDNSLGLDTQLPDGHQAIGIRVNPETIAGGFASLPNSKVNIISTVKRSSDRESYSKILLENVLVLAADDKMRVGEDGRAMPANVVTVALKPEDVLKLELAKTLGTISLALRKLGDVSRSEHTKVTPEGLGPDPTLPAELTNYSSPLPTPKVDIKPTPVTGKGPIPAGPVHTIDIFNGAQHQRFNIPLKDGKKKDESSDDGSK